MAVSHQKRLYRYPRVWIFSFWPLFVCTGWEIWEFWAQGMGTTPPQAHIYQAKNYLKQ